MKFYIKEDLNSSEKTHIHELEAMGFDIDYTLDSVGHLYKMRLILPWSNINISPQYRPHFKQPNTPVMDITLNIMKSSPSCKVGKFYYRFDSQTWFKERDFDKTMIELVDYVKSIADDNTDLFTFNFDLTPEQKNDRRIDHNLSDAINTLW